MTRPAAKPASPAIDPALLARIKTHARELDEHANAFAAAGFSGEGKLTARQLADDMAAVVRILEEESTP